MSWDELLRPFEFEFFRNGIYVATIAGALCGVGDVDGMAAAAVHLLSDAARWTATSALAASDARARFGMDAVVGQYERFYQRAIRNELA